MFKINKLRYILLVQWLFQMIRKFQTRNDRCLFLFQVLKTEKDKEEMKHEEEMQEIMEKHAKETQDMGKD